MTIKEIEERSGMTRANIRFYEQEGLLSPARAANGYRDYSEADLITLERIHLLRSVGMSIPEILALQRGETELSVELRRRIESFEQLRESAAEAQELCRAMRADGVRYDTLDAQKYLNMRTLGGRELEPMREVVEHLKCPWRRFFARWLDFLLYQLILEIPLYLGLRINPSSGIMSIVPFAALVVMLVVEPLLLHLFGTTPGKALLGLYIEDENGCRPSYKDARERTSCVIVRGMGCCIPIYQLVRMYKSLRECEAGEPLYWDWPLVLCLRDNKNWRTAVYVGAAAVWALVIALLAGMSSVPPNRGDITIAEFAENYNTLARHYDIDDSRCLTPEGKWAERSSDYGEVVIYVGSTPGGDFEFELQDGYITAVSFTDIRQGDDNWMYPCDNTMILAALSFAGAQRGVGPFSGERSRITDVIYDKNFEDFSFECGGVTVSSDVEYSGYLNASDLLIPEEGADTEFYMYFRMEKNG